jgi:hypothetical protein
MASSNQEIEKDLILRLRHSERGIKVIPVATNRQEEFLHLRWGSVKLRVQRAKTTLDSASFAPVRRSQRLVFTIPVVVVLAIVWHRSGLPLSDLIEVMRAVIVH